MKRNENKFSEANLRCFTACRDVWGKDIQSEVSVELDAVGASLLNDQCSC